MERKEKHVCTKHGELTGKSRYRISWSGKVILQLQHYHIGSLTDRGNGLRVLDYILLWRDATREDMKIDIESRQSLLEGIAGQPVDH